MKKIKSLFNWFDFLKVDNSSKEDLYIRKKIINNLSNEISEKLKNCQLSTIKK